MSSGFGDVKGWCIAWKRSVSSSHSNNGKSTTHKGANSSDLRNPIRFPNSIRNADNCARVLLAGPDNTKIKSPSLEIGKRRVGKDCMSSVLPYNENETC